MATTFERGVLLRDIPARTLDGRDVQISDYRGRRNVVLVFSSPQTDRIVEALQRSADDLEFHEAVVLIGPDSARDLYDAPKSAIFLTDRFGEIFFCARDPQPLPDADAVLGWLEFINAQCPE